MAEYCGYRIDFVGSTLGLDEKKAFPERDPVSRAAFRWGFRQSLAIGAAIHECGGADGQGPGPFGPERPDASPGSMLTGGSDEDGGGYRPAAGRRG